MIACILQRPLVQYTGHERFGARFWEGGWLGCRLGVESRVMSLLSGSLEGVWFRKTG